MAVIRILSYLLLLLVFSACGSVRKTSKEDLRVEESVKSKETTNEQTRIDTTRRENNLLEIVKITFEVPPPDFSGPIPKIKTPGGTEIPGRVKSAEITTLKEETEEAGVTEDIKESATETDQDKTTDKTTEEEKEVETYPLRWILAIVVLVIALRLFLRKKPPNILG